MKKAFTLLAAVTLMVGTAMAQLSTLSSAKPMQNNSKTALAKMLKANRGSKVAGNPIWQYTMSYCEDGTYYTGIGTQDAGDTVYWGIKIEAAALVGRDNITEVQFFVPNAGAGTYTVRLAQGSATATPIATQTVTAVNADTLTWKSITFSTPVAITQGSDLWVIMMNSDVAFPAATISETNDYDNAKWLSLDGTEWYTIAEASGGRLDATWMIRAISDTYTELPPYLTLLGPSYVRTGDTVNFVAQSPNADSFEWTINADYLDTTVNMASAMWSTPGTEQVIVMASNSTGDTYDTLDITVYSCDNITLPYAPSFTDGLGCWDTISDSTQGTGWFTANEVGLTVGQVVSISAYDPYGIGWYVDIPVDNWLTSPVIEMPSDGTYEVAWQVAPVSSSRNGDHYGVYVITENGINLIYEESLTGMAGFTQRMAILPDTLSGDFQIAFRYFNCEGGYAIILDSIQIRNLSAPVVVLNGPSAIENGTTAFYTAICGNAESFSWTINGTPVDATGNTLNNIFTTDGFQTVAVTATNSVGNASDSIVTEVYSCNNAISSFPYTYGFETGMRCWTMTSVDPANDDMLGVTEFESAYEGNYVFQFSSYNRAEDYNQYLISPELSLSQGTYMIKFQYLGYTQRESFRVLASTTTNNVNAFTEVLGTYSTTATEWTEVSFLIPAGTKYIAINYFGNYVYYLYIDNISIKVLDIVPSVELVGPESAESGENVTFVANAPLATSFSWTVDGADANTTGNTLTTSFTSAGNHTIKVVASNSIGNSTPATTTINIFSCEAVNAPWSESFEGSLQCWKFITNDQGSNGFTILENAQYAHSGEISLMGSYSDDFDVDQWAISPVITMPADAADYKLSFYVYTTSYQGINSNYEVLVSNGSANPADFTSVFTENAGTSSYVHHSIDMSSRAGQSIRIAFHNITAADGDAMLIDDITLSNNDDASGIDEIAGTSLSLYPNPATSTVTIIAEGIESNATAQVVDLNGRVVMEQHNNTGRFTFDVSNVARGAYFVRLTSENGSAVRKLIVR